MELLTSFYILWEIISILTFLTIRHKRLVQMSSGILWHISRKAQGLPSSLLQKGLRRSVPNASDSLSEESKRPPTQGRFCAQLQTFISTITKDSLRCESNLTKCQYYYLKIKNQTTPPKLDRFKIWPAEIVGEDLGLLGCVPRAGTSLFILRHVTL